MELLQYVDHTFLKPTATYEEVQKLAEEALQYQTASVCIPPSFISRLRKDYPSLTICTVIGFPLGYSTTKTKVFETKDAIAKGADEIDMVINLGDLKEGNFAAILKEIQEIKKACGSHILKVIIETCYLTEEEKSKMCEIVTESGSEYIKTSTGFGTNGATKEDIILFKKHIGAKVKIKAAGGIKNLDDLQYFIAEGCSRIGSSSAINLVVKKL